MFAPLLFLMLAPAPRAEASPAPLAGFVALSERPSPEELQCANYSDLEWIVFVDHGVVRAQDGGSRAVADPLPFELSPNDDRIGNRHVAKVSNGWLVGFDAGEFGGGLWWFSSDGRRSKRVRAPANVAHPDDIFRAENVRGFAQAGGDLLVLMGLDHLGGRSGRVFRAIQHAGGWALALHAVLDASPDAWALDEGRLLILTEGGLWEAGAGVGARQVHSSHTGGLYPSSLVRGADGAFYAGMRRYVLRLQPSQQGWRETWLAPSNCVRARIVDLDCECLP